METKVCTKCNQQFPATTEHFYRNKDGKLGLQSQCKPCKDKYFKGNQKVKEYLKVYGEKNRPHLSSYYKKYRQENYDQIVKQQRRYYQQNKEKILQNIKAYTERHWEQACKWKRIRAQRRRAKQRTLEASFTHKQWDNCLKQFEDKCAYCGKRKKLSQEHFVPLDKGGEYSLNNIIPACGSCNSSKRNADFFEWYPLQPFYSKTREKKILTYLNYKGDIQQLTLTV